MCYRYLGEFAHLFCHNNEGIKRILFYSILKSLKTCKLKLQVIFSCCWLANKQGKVLKDGVLHRSAANKSTFRSKQVTPHLKNILSNKKSFKLFQRQKMIKTSNGIQTRKCKEERMPHRGHIEEVVIKGVSLREWKACHFCFAQPTCREHLPASRVSHRLEPTPAQMDDIVRNLLPE